MMSYFKEIAVGFWSLIGGMAVTIRYFVKPIVTVQYPRDKIQMSPRYRGYPQFVIDPATQTHKCIACEMCSRICPITIEYPLKLRYFLKLILLSQPLWTIMQPGPLTDCF